MLQISLVLLYLDYVFFLKNEKISVICLYIEYKILQKIVLHYSFVKTKFKKMHKKIECCPSRV